LINPQQSYCEQRRITPAAARARFGCARAALARAANRHTLAVQAWLSTRAPDAARFEGAGVTATSTGLKVPLLNLALDSQFPSGAGVAQIDREIAAVCAFFADRDVPFMWWLSPFASPPDMGAHLLRHGFVRRPYRLPAMVAPLPPDVVEPAHNPAAQVWPARDRADLAAASVIRRVAFRFPPGAAPTYFEDMADDWLAGERARLYVARIGAEGPPVAMGALIMGAGLPGVYVMATLPQWERQGLGKAVLARILADAAAAGHRRIVLTAGARAYSLYRKFGFAHVFEYEVYEGQGCTG
jgi:GNAT superfamily N-acetyltransferase